MLECWTWTWTSLNVRWLAMRGPQEHSRWDSPRLPTHSALRVLLRARPLQIDVGDESVHVSIVYFSQGSGIVRWVADILTEPPYSFAPEGEHSSEILFECSWCGVP